MVSVCLPSDALLQHLPSYLGFSYRGRDVSLHGCSSKVKPMLLTLDSGNLLTTALPDLQRGIAPLGPPVPAQTWLGSVLPATAPGLGLKGVGYLLPAAGARAAATGVPTPRREELPHVRGQGQKPGGPHAEGQRWRGVTPRLRSGAAAESARLRRRRIGREELPHVRGQGERPRGDTQSPRSGAVTRGVTPRPRLGAAAGTEL